MPWKQFIKISLLIGIIALGGWLIWQQLNPDESTRWVTAHVTRGDIEESTTALGTLQPLNFVDVGTQVSGLLKKIHVTLGQTVKEGDLLAEIDPILYATRVEADLAQLQGLKAQLAEKQAQHTLAKTQYERQHKMVAVKATSEEAFESAYATLKTTQALIDQIVAQMRQVESTLKGDEANLGYTRIFAPMSGTVVSLPARQGQTLNANQQAPILLRIADLSTMTVWTQVSEADISHLKLGMEAYFTTLGRPDHRHRGQLRQILPTPDVVNNVILYNALLDVPNPKGELGIQMSAQVFFVQAAVTDALLIPIAALSKEEPKKTPDKRQDKSHRTPKEESQTANNTVRVLRNGQPETRNVEIGVKNRLQAQIISGLTVGEEVIIAQASTSKPPQSTLTGGAPWNKKTASAGGKHKPL